MAKKSMLERVINSDFGAKLGIPQGTKLRRYTPGEPFLDGPVVVGGGDLADDIRSLLQVDYQLLDAEADSKRAAIVFDATGITRPEQLHELYDFFHPQMRKLGASGRVVVIGNNPDDLEGDARIVARSLEGFSRSISKELRKGATGQLVYVEPGAPISAVESTLRFLLSGKSAFVSGQVIRVSATENENVDWERPLAGQLAVVTGAARGIGATIAEVLGRDGADVICIDIPPAGEALAEVANKVKGTALPLDVTADNAAEAITEHAQQRYGKAVDIIVHNAGVTRDKLLANMNEGQWQMVQNINLVAPVRITEQMLDNGGLAADANIVGISSMAGISGNRGQTNYATTKAGMIGLVDALAEKMAAAGGTVNAVAPGFIETAMTAPMPTGPREIGRRISSLNQGGLPVDVAETVAFFASSGSRAVNGNAVRVCGQNMMGA